MKKQIPALLAALIVTAILTGFMGVVSANAYFNQNGAPISNAPATASVAQADPNAQAQIAQLQARIDEYKQREQQYEALLQQDQAQIQQFKQFLLALQQRGIIRIGEDGRVVVPGG